MLKTSLMLDEIFEQPLALDRTLASALPVAEELRERLRRQPPSLVVIAARGTSDNAAQFGRYLVEIATGIPVSLAAASVYTLYGRQMRLKGALVIGISQSGESTDTNALLQNARDGGAITVGVTNEGGSAMAKIAEYTMLLGAGRENSVAATKTYTSQLLAMYLIGWALDAPIHLDDLRSIPGMVDKALTASPQVQEKAARFTAMDRAISVGRGLNYSNALEFGLKLMETCYVSTNRFSSADLMHGPIALIEEHFPVFVFAPGGPTLSAVKALIARVEELKANAFTITDESSGIVATDDSLVLPFSPLKGPGALGDLYTPIPYIVPAQLFAAHLSAAKGLDPDKPRTISKVTRTM